MTKHFPSTSGLPPCPYCHCQQHDKRLAVVSCGLVELISQTATGHTIGKANGISNQPSKISKKSSSLEFGYNINHKAMVAANIWEQNFYNWYSTQMCWELPPAWPHRWWWSPQRRTRLMEPWVFFTHESPSESRGEK